MARKLLYLVGEGVGNQVEAMPGVALLKKLNPDKEVCVMNVIRTRYDYTNFLFKRIATVVHSIDPAEYDGYYRSYCCDAAEKQINGLTLLNRDVKRGDFSEVSFNMQIVTDEISEDDFVLPGLFDDIDPRTDAKIVIHNGYNKASGDMWEAKSYPYFEELASCFDKAGLSVASIGSKDEYVKGTIDLTEMSLTNTIALLKGCKMFVSTDTGTYHLASLLGIHQVVLFTFTDRKKNYDKRFHKSCNVVYKELDCSPCQHTKPSKFWLYNREVCQWDCRVIDPLYVFDCTVEWIGLNEFLERAGYG